MNRRSLLGMLAAAPALAVVSATPADAPVKKVGGRRFSCRKGDPGYRDYCMARGDRQKVKIYLNGEEQKEVLTADESEGMVLRLARTPSGNLAHDGENLLEETVYGDVKIVLS